MSSIKEFEHLRVRLEAIKLATNNFGDNSYIGRGGFGKVYKGELIYFGERVTVAVKRLDRALGQGPIEFWKEIMMLSCYRHENLVSLLGFCDEDGENILVYEYLSNKSLDLYLSSTNLLWIQRVNICIGAARGLEYLHNPGRTTHRVLHRDIKSSNILLDENWKARISDFGLSKLGPANQEFTFLISHAVGTFGYCDPLYVDTGFLTKESDVYSFGVVLFEVLCGRLCIANYNDGRRFLSKLAQSCYEEKKLDTIVLDCLREQISPDCLDKFSAIAYQCLCRDRDERPSISEIVKQLQIALEYQVEYDFKKEKMLKRQEVLEYKKKVQLLPPPFQLGEISEEELKAYDGRDPKKPLLMAIKGQIYDVSQSWSFYGPGGPYALFAGKDASRGLAKMSFEEKDLNSDLTGLVRFEHEALQDWEDKFMSKYVKVGSIRKPTPPFQKNDVQLLPPPVQLGEISEEELKAYDGRDPKKPLLMAIKGQIYDVSQSRLFYGPGGPYELFAAKDASRGLAKMSFEEKDLNSDLTGLGPFEHEVLQDWEDKFISKYVKVGSIRKPKLHPE